MRKRKEFLPFFALGIISFICIILTLFFVNPEKTFYSISPIIIFFLFLFLASFSLAAYLFLNTIRGILIGLFITVLLILQISGFANIFYVIILLLIILVLDIGLKKK